MFISLGFNNKNRVALPILPKVSPGIIASSLGHHNKMTTQKRLKKGIWCQNDKQTNLIKYYALFLQA